MSEDFYEVLGVSREDEGEQRSLDLLLEPQRLARLLEAQAMSDDAYALGTMLDDLRTGLWSELDGGDAIGPYRRNLQRGYIERMDYLMTQEPTVPARPASSSSSSTSSVISSSGSSART